MAIHHPHELPLHLGCDTSRRKGALSGDSSLGRVHVFLYPLITLRDALT
jgi:hypothetical protein